jgi:hypothetical protein
MKQLMEALLWRNIVALLVMGALGYSSLPAVASVGGLQKPRKVDRQEVPTDPYVQVDRSTMPTSPAYRYSSNTFFAVQVNVDDSSRNIVGDAANEPSIAVDPINSDRIAIGWRQFDTITNSFRQAGYGYTTDGGLTWTFPGVIEPGIFRSDPVLESDSLGTFYYNSLTVVGSDFECTVFRSFDGAATWDTGTFAQGGDKQWMAIDKTGSLGQGNIYAYWTSSFSVCSPGFFTRSTDGGGSYEACVVIPNDPFWGTLDVGADGELYVCGAGSTDFVVAKSSTARDSSQVVSWDFASTIELDGDISAFGGSNSPNPSGLLGQAWVAVDHSDDSTRGNVYVLCSVERQSNSDPLDVMFSRSTDGGLTWSSPVRVNDDTTDAAWQWFGTMSVAPNGRIDVIWLDTRDDPGGLNSALYYSHSTDAGVTWSKNEKLSESFDPHVGWPQQQKMGDYFDMVSDDAGAHIAWAGTFNGEQDVYYGRITLVTDVDESAGTGVPVSFVLDQNYPNPFNPVTTIRFTVGNPERTTLRVYDILGREVATLIDDDLAPGTYTKQWDASGQASGVYYYRLSSGGFVETRKLVLLR